MGFDSGTVCVNKYTFAGSLQIGLDIKLAVLCAFRLWTLSICRYFLIRVGFCVPVPLPNSLLEEPVVGRGWGVRIIQVCTVLYVYNLYMAQS